jgi:hypothetical protein
MTNYSNTQEYWNLKKQLNRNKPAIPPVFATEIEQPLY